MTPRPQARKLRRQLEAFHGSRTRPRSSSAWPHLNSGDRAIRYAARVAIEHQDPKLVDGQGAGREAHDRRDPAR